MVSKAQQKAVNTYKKKRDNCMVYFPLGTAEAVRDQGQSVSGLCQKLVEAWLAERGVVISESQNPPKRSARKDQARTKETKIAHDQEPPQISEPAAHDTMILDTVPEPGESPESIPAASESIKNDNKPRTDIIDLDSFL